MQVINRFFIQNSDLYVINKFNPTRDQTFILFM